MAYWERSCNKRHLEFHKHERSVKPLRLYEFGYQEKWILDSDELALLPRMANKWRLGLAIQLKFRQICGRYLGSFDEVL